MPCRTKRTAEVLVVLAMLLYAGTYGYAGLQRHITLHSCTFDLGILTQVTWNTAHGRLFETSIDRATNQELVGSYLGNHVRPILIPLALLYRLWPDPRLLLVLQTAALAAGAWPLFVITCRRTGSSWLSLAIICCYLAYPALGFANLYDFHPVCLSIPLLFMAYLALQTDHNVLFWVATLLALSTKEEMVVPLGTWALVLVLERPHRRTGWILLSIVAAYSLACFGFIIPAFNEGKTYRFLALWSHLLGAQAADGGALHLIGESALMSKVVFMLHLVLPLGLPFFPVSPTAMVALPSLLYLLLGRQPELHALGYQYPAVLVPWFFLSSVEGLSWLTLRAAQQPRAQLVLRLAIASMIAGTFASNLIMNPIVLQRRQGNMQRSPDHERALYALSLIPAHAGVATGNRFGAHLADRRVLVAIDYPPPLRLDHVLQADYVLLDLVDCRAVEADDPRATYAQMVRQVLSTGAFRVRYWSGRILLLEKGEPLPAQIKEVTRYIDDLVRNQRPCWP